MQQIPVPERSFPNTEVNNTNSFTWSGKTGFRKYDQVVNLVQPRKDSWTQRQHKAMCGKRIAIKTYLEKVAFF